MNDRDKQLIWEAYLTEQPVSPPAPPASQPFGTPLGQVFDDTLEARLTKRLGGLDYNRYYEELGRAISEPGVKALLLAGHEDGDLDDDKLPVTRGAFACHELKPLQNLIGLSNSLAWPGKQPQNVCTILDGGPIDGLFFTPPGKPEPNRLVTATIQGVNYVVDGHHRWSQIYMINPKAQLTDTYHISIEGKKGDMALRISQLLISAIKGSIPVAGPSEGDINVYSKVADRELSNWLSNPENMSDEFYQAWSECASSPEIEKENIIDRIVKNIHILRERSAPDGHAPDRELMPQFDRATPDGIVSTMIKQLADGIINWNPIARPLDATQQNDQQVSVGAAAAGGWRG